MKLSNDSKAAIAPIALTLIAAIVGLLLVWVESPNEQLGQPLVGYSDTTWTVGDTLVWRHGSDTLKLDLSKFK